MKIQTTLQTSFPVLLLVSTLISCGSSIQQDSESPLSEDQYEDQSLDITQEPKVDPGESEVVAPSPVTGGYLLCQKQDSYTYCRLQESALNSEKIQDSIKWGLAQESDQFQELSKDSRWHIRFKDVDQNLDITATLESNPDKSFHRLDSMNDGCEFDQIQYKDHCLTQSGTRHTNYKMFEFDHAFLWNTTNQSYSTFLSYPILNNEHHSEFQYRINWTTNNDNSCQSSSCNNHFAVFLLRLNAQGTWVRRDVECFELDKHTPKGSLWGKFMIPDDFEVYYLSQPIPIKSQFCQSALKSDLSEPLESFGAIVPNEPNR